VQGAFDRRVCQTLATLRRHGSARISGTELIFADPELWMEARRAA
jgi:hypothetical protein